MTATLGKWEIRTDLSKDSGIAVSRICCYGAANTSRFAHGVEQEASDFIARHVLDDDLPFV